MDNQVGVKEKSALSSIPDEELTAEEELEISGYQPEQAGLIDQEFLIQRDREQSEPRDSSENPYVRGAFATSLVGGVMGCGWTIWSIFFAAKPIIKPAIAPNQTLPVATDSQNNEASRLKAELALRNQASHTLQQPQKLPSPSPPERITAHTTSSPARVATTRMVSQSPPPPRIIRERVPVQLPQPKTFIAPSPAIPTLKIDPFERWHQLATVGQQTFTGRRTAEEHPSWQQAQVLPDKSELNKESAIPERGDIGTADKVSVIPQRSEVLRPLDTLREQTIATTDKANKDLATIPVVSIGNSTIQSNSDSAGRFTPLENREQIQTPGELGILNRTSQNFQGSITTSDSSPMQIPIGTSVAAKVLVPMVWAEEDKNQGRFAVELQSDVLSTNNRVALPKGTILITQVDSVSQTNKLVKQSAVAVVYPDIHGQIRQQTLPKDAILIRGENSQPLVARAMEDRSVAIAQQDILIGLLDAAGKAGEIFNQNRNQSSTVITNGGFSSQSISTTASKPNILAAAVEGFFKPMSQRLGQRADRSSQELSSRPNVAIVPAGKKVSIFFNTFFEVYR